MVVMALKDLEKLGDQYSALVITPVEKMQDTANQVIKSNTKSASGVYVALNRPHESIEKTMKADGIKTDKLFFVDCVNVSGGGVGDNNKVSHIQNPSDLTSMNIAVNQFMEKIDGKKFLVLDSLTTLLIYNKENLVIMFVKSLIDEMRKSNAKLIVLTPELSGGELLNKIALFFDKVMKV
jgi:hypothetical protein